VKGPLYERSPSERADILDAVRHRLQARPEVVFAFAYGSFPEERPFHDVDVAVYLDVEEKEAQTELALALAAELEEVAHLPFDVRVLNHAPLGFRYHVFRGRFLFSRDEELCARCLEHTAMRYLDIKPLMRQALKEAMRV
jgi:predicted nucleotidyltransferase